MNTFSRDLLLLLAFVPLPIIGFTPTDKIFSDIGDGAISDAISIDLHLFTSK